MRLKKNEIIESDRVLKQHSALITFKTEQEYYNIDTEKSIISILADTQMELQKLFFDIYKPYLRRLFSDSKTIDNLLKIAYVKDGIKKINIDFSKIKSEEVPKLKEEILRKKIEAAHSSLIDKTKKEKYLLDIEGIDVKKLSMKNMELLVYTDNELIELIESIKDICVYETLNRYGRTKIIDFTSFSNRLGMNSKRLKDNLIKASKIQLSFNYIDKKNLKIESVSNMIASIAFIQKKRMTWMSYQIPDEILKYLLMPEVYVHLQEKNTHKLTGKYSIRLYSFLKDHIKFGYVTITKEQCKGFFQLPESYLKNKQHLVNRFLIPTIADIKVKTGMCIEYELIPNYNFKEIKFTMRQQIIKTNNENEPITVDALSDVEIDEQLSKAITKAKRNIYVSKAWNKNVDNKILKLLKDFGSAFTCEILNDLYSNLKQEIEKTLVQYINGIIKNKKEEASIKMETKIKRTEKELKNKTIKKVSDMVKSELPNVSSENKTLYDICKEENRLQSQDKYIVSMEEYKKELERYIEIGNTEKMADMILNKMFIIKEEE